MALQVNWNSHCRGRGAAVKAAGGELTVTCSACHRSLSDPVSIAAGMGPVCRRRRGVAEPSKKGSNFSDHATRSTWSFTIERDLVLVEDECQGMSVTNDAEAVIAELAKCVPLAGRRVLYRDSDKRWDELLVRDGRFAGFSPIGAITKDAAIAFTQSKPTVQRRIECHSPKP